MNKIKGWMLMTLCCVLAIGCTKDPVEPDSPSTDDVVKVNAWVLNEGTWSKNNASVSSLDCKQGVVMEKDAFGSQNGRGLGDVAQDMVVYGEKMYIVVWHSNTVEVVDAKSGKSIKQISFAGKGPRYADVKDGKVYVCCYDGTVARIDTTSLEIEANCTVTGMQPEGICVAGDKLCVVHGWTYGANGDIIRDSTMSVVDIASFTSERQLTVGLNPFCVMNYDGEHVVVGYWGDYGANPSGIDLVNLSTGERRALKEHGASKFDMCDGYLYMYDYDYGTLETTFWKIDVLTGEQVRILENIDVKLKSTYGINVDAESGDIYVTDSQEFRSNGDVHCFTSEGVHKWSVETGMGPSQVIFM